MGAALAQALSNNLRLLFLVIYVVYFFLLFFFLFSFFRKAVTQVLGSWSWSALREWGLPLRLSIARTSVDMAEWLAF